MKKVIKLSSVSIKVIDAFNNFDWFIDKTFILNKYFLLNYEIWVSRIDLQTSMKDWTKKISETCINISSRFLIV